MFNARNFIIAGSSIDRSESLKCSRVCLIEANRGTRDCLVSFFPYKISSIEIRIKIHFLRGNCDKSKSL